MHAARVLVRLSACNAYEVVTLGVQKRPLHWRAETSKCCSDGQAGSGFTGDDSDGCGVGDLSLVESRKEQLTDHDDDEDDDELLLLALTPLAPVSANVAADSQPWQCNELLQPKRSPSLQSGPAARSAEREGAAAAAARDTYLCASASC